MKRQACWVIEKYGYRECSHPKREFGYAVSLHNHSTHSVENLASLNDVVKLAFMRPLASTLQWAFGLDGVSGLDYADVQYNPPFTPEDVYRMESAAAASLGFDGVHLAITDHNECIGGLELLHRRPDLNGRIALGEELSVRFQDHLFHLGVVGLPASHVDETHRRIQAAARGGRLDELFETLDATGCLTVLNHPLVPWDLAAPVTFPWPASWRATAGRFTPSNTTECAAVKRTTASWNSRANGASRWWAAVTATCY